MLANLQRASRLALGVRGMGVHDCRIRRGLIADTLRVIVGLVDNGHPELLTGEARTNGLAIHVSAALALGSVWDRLRHDPEAGEGPGGAFLGARRRGGRWASCRFSAVGHSVGFGGFCAERPVSCGGGPGATLCFRASDTQPTGASSGRLVAPYAASRAWSRSVYVYAAAVAMSLVASAHEVGVVRSCTPPDLTWLVAGISVAPGRSQSSRSLPGSSATATPTARG